MGFFSWITQDTNRSIANTSSIRATFPVTMVDNKGNKWVEKEYDGYGEFGGKDYYQLLAEMNEADGLTGNVNNDRLIGINIAFGNKAYISPNLVEDRHGNWEWVNRHPNPCNYQGYFYDDEQEDFNY